MNNKILCVTCLRDFYKLQRQIESFILYLPIEYEIIYVIEGRNYQEFLKLWDEYSDNHSRLKNTITIKFAHDYVSLSTNRYYDDPKFTGWHRQQLLKLLGVANQNDDRVIVIDSKDFLIKELPLNIVDSHICFTRNDSYWNNDYAKNILPVYEKTFNIYLDTRGAVTTPFTMIPTVVKNGINSLENFNRWWIDTSIEVGWMSEFQLYHLWHVDQNYPLLTNNNKKFGVWINVENRKDFISKIEEIKNDNDIYWFGLGNNTTTVWDNNLKKSWNNWLYDNGYVGRWNTIDTDQTHQS